MVEVVVEVVVVVVAEVMVSSSVVPESEHPQTTLNSASVAVVVTESMTPVHAVGENTWKTAT